MVAFVILMNVTNFHNVRIIYIATNNKTKLKKMKRDYIYIGLIIILILIGIFGDFNSPSKAINYLSKHGDLQIKEMNEGNFYFIYTDNDSCLNDEEKRHLNYLNNYYNVKY